MSIALFAVPGVLAPLQGMWRWFTAATAQGRPTHSGADPLVSEFPIGSAATNSHCTRIDRQTSSETAARRPLRVVRVLEVGQAPTHVGRMVISGRMADVCAELDRLAAREAALH